MKNKTLRAKNLQKIAVFSNICLYLYIIYTQFFGFVAKNRGLPLRQQQNPKLSTLMTSVIAKEHSDCGNLHTTWSAGEKMNESIFIF
jgi:hypothetical protein